MDIGAAFPATLGFFSFEGATKKNRLNLQVGSTVYARVLLANKDMDPELTCVSARNKAEGYGELNGGYLFKCSISLAYTYTDTSTSGHSLSRLLDEECVLLKLLGKAVPFEIAVGMNGKVWVNSHTRKNTALIANAIINSEFLEVKQIQAMVAKLIPHFEQIQTK